MQQVKAPERLIQPGWSFYVCFGPWARPHWYRSPLNARLCLGWVSVGVLFYDVEAMLTGLTARMVNAERTLVMLAEGRG